MTAEEQLKAGDVDGAMETLKNEVRENPADSKRRIFLFQLFCIQGQWERAITQLNAAAEMDPLALMMSQMYGAALNCQAVRDQVLQGERTPLIFGEPPEWIGPLLQALKLNAQGHHQAAAELRAKAFEAAPTSSGSINGTAFAWLADADGRFGPTIEGIIDGKYYWIPVECLGKFSVEQPADLRDLVWAPAQFTFANGGQVVGLIPTRYPGSESHADPAVRMARRTDWQEAPGDLYVGLGQRLLATDAGEFPLLEAREVLFDREIPQATEAEEETA